MTKAEKEEIERLINLNEVDMYDKSSALGISKKYINSGASYCLTCDGSVRLMFNRLKDWWSKQGPYQFIKTKE